MYTSIYIYCKSQRCRSLKGYDFDFKNFHAIILAGGGTWVQTSSLGSPNSKYIIIIPKEIPKVFEISAAGCEVKRGRNPSITF